jgi:methylamine utilization protein MauE
VAIALRSLSIFFAGLLVLAVVHKVRVLSGGQAERDPLMRLSRWRLRHASGLLLAAGILEAGIAVLLLVSPLAGYGALFALALGYAIDLRRLADDQACNCFGSALQASSRRAVIARNVCIAGVSSVAASLYATSAAGIEPVTQSVIGVALIITAAVAGVDLLRYVPRVEPGTESRG